MEGHPGSAAGERGRPRSTTASSHTVVSRFEELSSPTYDTPARSATVGEERQCQFWDHPNSPRPQTIGFFVSHSGLDDGARSVLRRAVNSKTVVVFDRSKFRQYQT